MQQRTNKANLAAQIVEHADRHAGQPRDQIAVRRLLSKSTVLLLIRVLEDMATVTSKLPGNAGIQHHDPYQALRTALGSFRTPRRLTLTAETPAQVPTAQLAPRPRPRV